MFILAPEPCLFDFNDWLEITKGLDNGKIDYLTAEKTVSPVVMKTFTYDVIGTVIKSQTRQIWTYVENANDTIPKGNPLLDRGSTTTVFILQECDAFRYYGKRYYGRKNNIVTEEAFLINTDVYDNDRDAILTILKLMVK